MDKELPKLAANMVMKIRTDKGSTQHIYITDATDCGRHIHGYLLHHDSVGDAILLISAYHWDRLIDKPLELVAVYGISNPRCTSGYSTLSPTLLSSIIEGEEDDDALINSGGSMLIWEEPHDVDGRLTGLCKGLKQLKERLGHIQSTHSGYGESGVHVAMEVEDDLDRLIKRYGQET